MTVEEAEVIYQRIIHFEAQAGDPELLAEAALDPAMPAHIVELGSAIGATLDASESYEILAQAASLAWQNDSGEAWQTDGNVSWEGSLDAAAAVWQGTDTSLRTVFDEVAVVPS